MQKGPDLAAETPHIRKRACPVKGARLAILSSCNRLKRAGKRAELSQIIILQLTAQGWEYAS